MTRSAASIAASASGKGANDVMGARGWGTHLLELQVCALVCHPLVADAELPRRRLQRHGALLLGRRTCAGRARRGEGSDFRGIRVAGEDGCVECGDRGRRRGRSRARRPRAGLCGGEAGSGEGVADVGGTVSRERAGHRGGGESGEADGEEDGEMKSSEWLQIRELTGNRRPVLQVA